MSVLSENGRNFLPQLLPCRLHLFMRCHLYRITIYSWRPTAEANSSSRPGRAIIPVLPSLRSV